MYYLCSENKDADQLCGVCEADMHLCFCICKKTVFSRRGSYEHVMATLKYGGSKLVGRNGHNYPFYTYIIIIDGLGLVCNYFMMTMVRYCINKTKRIDIWHA